MQFLRESEIVLYENKVYEYLGRTSQKDEFGCTERMYHRLADAITGEFIEISMLKDDGIISINQFDSELKDKKDKLEKLQDEIETLEKRKGFFDNKIKVLLKGEDIDPLLSEWLTN